MRERKADSANCIFLLASEEENSSSVTITNSPCELHNTDLSWSFLKHLVWWQKNKHSTLSVYKDLERIRRDVVNLPASLGAEDSSTTSAKLKSSVAFPPSLVLFVDKRCHVNSLLMWIPLRPKTSPMNPVTLPLFESYFSRITERKQRH